VTLELLEIQQLLTVQQWQTVVLVVRVVNKYQEMNIQDEAEAARKVAETQEVEHSHLHKEQGHLVFLV
jgi:hypothetical protein